MRHAASVSRASRALRALGCLLAGLAVLPDVRALPLDTLEQGAEASAIAARSPLVSVTRAGTRLVAVGQRGHVLTSDDNGRQWLQARVPVSSDLVAAHFPSAALGWAVGHDGVILHSADSGRSWSKQLDGRGAAQAIVAQQAGQAADASAEARAILAEAQRMLAEGPDQPFLDVWFENERKGYAIGAFNLIFMTQDGGKTWLPISDRVENPKSHHLYAMHGSGSELYIAGELGLLLRLDRAKDRFVAVTTPYKGTWFGVLASQDWVLAFGLRGNAWRSADGGKSWRKIETRVSTGLTGGAVLEDGRVVLVSQSGQILFSSDGAQSFDRVPNSAPMALFGVAASRDQSLVLVGARGARVQPIDRTSGR